MQALSFLDVQALLQMEKVNRTWQNLCKKTIVDKCGPTGPEAFQSNQELKDAVKKYCEAGAMEEIACTYGYPIDKWDVSQVEDMSEVFWEGKHSMITLVHGMFLMSKPFITCLVMHLHSTKILDLGMYPM
jgi:hypothetical protein